MVEIIASDTKMVFNDSNIRSHSSFEICVHAGKEDPTKIARACEQPIEATDPGQNGSDDESKLTLKPELGTKFNVWFNNKTESPYEIQIELKNAVFVQTCGQN